MGVRINQLFFDPALRKDNNVGQVQDNSASLSEVFDIAFEDECNIYFYLRETNEKLIRIVCYKRPDLK